MPRCHARDSIRSVDANTWIVGDHIVLSRSKTESQGSWDDGEGAFFTASEADTLGLEHTATHQFPLVYDVGDVHAVWKVGKAFLKVVDLDIMHATREHVTLRAVHAMKPSFAIPKVLFHGEWEERYYLFLTEIPGQRLNEAWQSMDEATKDKYVEKITSICEQLATHESQEIAGVDGQHLPERYLIKRDQPLDFGPPLLLQTCREMGMESSKTVFCHCDLGPTNIIVNTTNDSVGVIDWEIAGFVPREWIRTKFRISGGMDLENDETARNPSLRHEWRRSVQVRLGEKGFSDCATEWVRWSS